MRGLMFVFIILVIFVLLPGRGEAKAYFQYNVGYSSETDGDAESSSSSMRHIVALGATFGGGDTFVLAQSLISSTVSNKASASANTAELALLELGPRLIWYLNEERNFSLSGAWHPYVNGTRKTAAGISQDVSGNSYFASLAYELKVTKSFYMGASLNYYSMTLTQSTVSGTITEITDAYSSIYPTLEFSIRF